MSTPPKPRAIIHTRVSRDQQADNTSHGSQLAAALKKADEIGAEIVRTFQEEVSGALYKARPDIQESLRMVESGEADMLIFARLDRAGRDVDNLRAIKKRIERAGGKLIFADGLQIQAGAFGDLMFTQMGTYAEYERAIIGERTLIGLRAKATEGIQVSRNKPAYAYRLPTKINVLRGEAQPEDEGRYFIIEEQAAHIRLIFEQYAAGTSTYGISRQLRDAGIPSPTGLHTWSIQTITNIIRNPIYKGVAGWGKTRTYVDETRTERGLKLRVQTRRADGEWVAIPAPPIVSAELWDKANARLAQARELHSGRKDRKYALTGLMRCPACRRRLASMPDRRVKTPGHLRTQYYCQYAARETTRPPCTNKRWYSSHAHEKLVIAAILSLLKEPAILEETQREYSERRKAERSEEKSWAAVEQLKRKLSELKKKEQAVAVAKVEAKLAGGDEAVFNNMLANIATERARLNNELATQEKQLQNDAPALLVFPLEYVALVERVLTDQSGEVTGAMRHEILSSLISEIFPVGAPQSPAVKIHLADTDAGGAQWVIENSRKGLRFTIEKAD